MVLVVLAAVNQCFLKPPEPDTNYFFLQNFRVKFTFGLGSFYEVKEKRGVYTGHRHMC